MVGGQPIQQRPPVDRQIPWLGQSGLNRAAPLETGVSRRGPPSPWGSVLFHSARLVRRSSWCIAQAPRGLRAFADRGQPPSGRAPGPSSVFLQGQSNAHASSYLQSVVGGFPSPIARNKDSAISKWNVSASSLSPLGQSPWGS